MHSIEIHLQRNLDNRYLFYKSFNLVTARSILSYNELPLKCELTFRLLQFNIHLNLKTDSDFELFQKTCQDYVIAKKNYFECTLKRCFVKFELKPEREDESYINSQRLLNIFSDAFFYIIIGIILMILCPVFATTCLHLRNKTCNH